MRHLSNQGDDSLCMPSAFGMMVSIGVNVGVNDGGPVNNMLVRK